MKKHRKPNVEDGEFKIIGDPNNRIFRVNENTGRPQVLDESNGLWSNTEESPNLFFEIVSRSGFQKSKDKINAKYDAELKELENNTQTSETEQSVSADIKAKKADIERRRKLTTITPDGNPQGFESEGIWYFEYIAPDGYRSQYYGADKQKVLDKINAKYDAEIEALSDQIRAKKKEVSDIKNKQNVSDKLGKTRIPEVS